MEGGANSKNESQADKLPCDHAGGLSAISRPGGWVSGGLTCCLCHTSQLNSDYPDFS